MLRCIGAKEEGVFMRLSDFLTFTFCSNNEKGKGALLVTYTMYSKNLTHSDWRQSYIHVLMVGETGAPRENTNRWRTCKLYIERPCPTRESNPGPSCYEATVLNKHSMIPVL